MNAQQNNQPAAAPAASSPQTWRYPFPGKDHKEITDPDIFYHALAGMEDGFFPLGVNGFPHGGVHFGKGSSSRVDQSGGVRVIANGEVVAFRLDDAYAQLHFTQDRRWAMYSTGFVLVRHHMTMPPAPGNTASGQPADETLTFYSLYMHMADWPTYLADGSMVRPGWWPGVDAYRIGNKDKQENGGAAAGAFVWSEPRPGTKKNQFVAGQHVAFLPEGSEVLIGEKRGAWGHIRSISAGHMASANNGGYFGWEDQNVPWVQPDGDETGAIPITPEGDWGWLYLHDQQPVKEPQGVGRVVVPPQPIPVKAGTLMGQIGEYHDYERSTPLPPVPVRQLLHLEVFAGDELKEFIGKCRARAAQLPASDRSVLVVQAGAKLVVQPADSDHKLGTRHPLYDAKETVRSPKAGPWVQVQPRYLTIGSIAALDGGPVWIRRDDLNRGPNGLSAWKRFPLQVQALADPANAQTFAFPRAQLDGIGDGDVAVDDENMHWWRVGFVAADGTDQRGWICEKGHPGTTLESPWAWPGFEIVDATGIALTDAFRRNLSVTGSADWKEQTEFEPSTAAVNGSALLQRLEQTVSRIPLQYGEKKSSKDGQEVVTARKLQRAMNKSWLASELAHVILRYETEWGGGMSRWEALTPLMRNARENWQCELQRIRKLQWWDSVKGKVEGFPASAVVHHIHPIAMVGNFFATCFPLEKALEMALLITGSFEGSSSPTLRYDAVADNFDGMGMSFGIVQWNFGMGTLAPVFRDMIAVDEIVFKECFNNIADYNSLLAALGSSTGAQKQWAINQQHSNPSGWSAPFRKIGSIDKFNKIQLKHAGTYHGYVVNCITWLRSLRPMLMDKVELQTYCALYDLCVQQQTLNSAHSAIQNRVAAESPTTQNQLMIIVVEERAKKALPQYQADCLSRRRGILQQCSFTVPHTPQPVTRTNINFSTLQKVATEYVCEL
jgi:hypothetical protein